MPTNTNRNSYAGRQNMAARMGDDLPPIPSDYKMRLIGTTDYLTIVNTNRVSAWEAVGATHTATQGDNSVRPYYDPLYVTPNG